MNCQASKKHIVSQWLAWAMYVLGDRFVIRKGAVLVSVPSEEKVDIFWRFVTIFIWVFCIYMRRYDIILRGCSPIALETLIPLLRVALVEYETVFKKEDLNPSSAGNGNTHRSSGVSSIIARNTMPQQRRKDRIGSQTTFAIEQFAWFAIIFVFLDLTNIHRLSVALFLVNTLHWIRLSLKSTAYLVGLYVIATYFWYPAYSLRDTFLTISGHRSWVHNMYSSYSLAFSLTLLVTETRFLQRARLAVVGKVLVAPVALENSLANTSLKKVCSLARWLLDYFFFVGFNFWMALCMWFSIMMFEWTLEVSCMGIICTVIAIPVIVGEGWMDNPQKALREGILCLLSYLIVGLSVFLCIPVNSLSFTANSVLSSLFVFYMAAHSPRRVRSSLPLALVWLAMVGVDAYWQANQREIGVSHTLWYNQILCINTIVFGGLFLISTAAHVYCCEWPTEPVPAATTVVLGPSIKPVSSIKYEHKSREKPFQLMAQANVDKPFVSETAATETFAASSLPGRRVAGDGEENLHPLSFSSPLSESSSSLPASAFLENVKLVRTAGLVANAGKGNESDETLGESVTKSPVSPIERSSILHLDAEEETDAGIHKMEFVSGHAAETTTQGKSTVTVSTTVDVPNNTDGSDKGGNDGKLVVAVTEKKKVLMAVVMEPRPADGKTESLPRLAVSQEMPHVVSGKEEKATAIPSTFLSSTSASKRDREEVRLSPLVASDVQTTGSLCGVEQKYGAIKKKTPKIMAEVHNRASNTENKGDCRIAGVKTERSTVSPEGVVSRDVSIPLPRGLRAKVVSLPLKTEGAAAEMTKARESVVFGKEFPTTVSSAQATVTNSGKEHDTKPSTRKGNAAINVQQQATVFSLQKGANVEAVKTKRQALEKVVPLVNATPNVKQPTSLPQQKALEKRHGAPETRAAAGATIRTTAVTKANNTVESHLDSEHRGNKNSRGNTNASGGVIFNIPQPRSTKATATTTVALTTTTMKKRSTMESTEAPSSTRYVVEAVEKGTKLWEPKTSSGARVSEVLRRLDDKSVEEASSHGDDDVPLDLAELHLGLLGESEPCSPHQNVSTLQFDASRGIPQSARNALENFAKAWMPHEETLESDHDAQLVKMIGIKENQANTKLMQPHLVVTSPPSFSQVASSDSVCLHSPLFTDPRVNAVEPGAVSSLPSTSKVDEHERANKNSYVVSHNLPNNVPVPTQIDSQLSTLAQPQMHQQVPLVMLQMGDGRLALYPVFQSTYPTTSPVVMSTSHVKLPQNQPRQPVNYPHMIFPTQQMYSPAWSQLNQHNNTTR